MSNYQQTFHLTCQGCGHNYWSKEAEPLLCPDCNEEYISDEVCPQCGGDRYEYHIPNSGGVVHYFCVYCDTKPCPNCETLARKLELVRAAIWDVQNGSLPEQSFFYAVAAIVTPQPDLTEDDINWAKSVIQTKGK